MVSAQIAVALILEVIQAYDIQIKYEICFVRHICTVVVL